MSRIRTNLITNRMANGAPTVSNGLVISGVTTSTTFSGSGASLTNLPAAQLTGTLPAIDGSNLTNITSTTINNNGSNRIITGSGTANTLEGESTFTYNGTHIAKIDTNQTYAMLQLDGSSSGGGAIEFYADATRKFEIYGIDAGIEIFDREKGAYHSKFLSGGDLEISDGKLLIGTTTEGHSNADNLTIASSGETGITIRSGTSNQSSLYFSDATSGTGEYAGSVVYNHSNNKLFLATSSSNRLTIDSDGRLLVGTSSVGQDDADNLTIDGSGEGTGRTGITIRSATNTFGSIFFSDATSGAAQYDGVVAYDHSTQTMRFSTASTQRVFINSNGVVTNSNQPVFSATTSSTSSAGFIVFNQTSCNAGNHYSTSNGRFTAPVAGNYYFSFYGMSPHNNTSNQRCAIYVNGSYWSAGQYIGGVGYSGYTNGGYTHLTLTTALTLSANDYVQIDWQYADLHAGHCKFSGFLIG